MTVQEQASPETTTEGAVEYEVSDGIATIWLNRPRVKNCFNWEQLTTFGAALERAEEDDDARVVVVRGRGHTFCAGADLNMLDSEFLKTSANSIKIAQVSARTFDRAFNLAQADDRRRRGLRGRRRLRAVDLVRLPDRRRRREDRRLPHPPRAVRRRRPDLPPAALHRPAQDQGAAVHRQAAVRQGVLRLGSGERVRPGRGDGSGDRATSPLR